MPNILVRGVPEDVHAELQRRAEEQGQSLQQFLTGEFTRIAQKRSIAELFRRDDRHEGGHVGLVQAVEDLSKERARR